VKDDRAYLSHVRDALDRILDYTRDGRQSFLADRKTQDAVIRNFEIVGEAAKHLSAEIRAREPSVDWKAVAGMRDKLIHAYFGVKLDVVWRAVEMEVQPLREAAVRLLETVDR